jgi:hypothetical protein
LRKHQSTLWQPAWMPLLQRVPACIVVDAVVCRPNRAASLPAGCTRFGMQPGRNPKAACNCSPLQFWRISQPLASARPSTTCGKSDKAAMFHRCAATRSFARPSSTFILGGSFQHFFAFCMDIQRDLPMLLLHAAGPPPTTLAAKLFLIPRCLHHQP